MKKKVLITVKTTQTFDEETDIIELVTEGSIIKNNNRYTLEYEESEISGMSGTTTTIEVTEDTVELIRKGSTNSHLKFKKGYNHLSLYGVEDGAFEISVKTKSINININEFSGQIELDYKIESQGVNISHNVLLLTIKSIR